MQVCVGLCSISQSLLKVAQKITSYEKCVAKRVVTIHQMHKLI